MEFHYTSHIKHYTNAQRHLYEMRTTGSIRVVSYQREGRLVPQAARGLRARSVELGPGQVMEWHSTHDREELLIALKGRVRLEVWMTPRRTRRRQLAAGQCAFLPRKTRHRVVNGSKMLAHYVYVTAPAQ